jgi:hypothetical protein
VSQRSKNLLEAFNQSRAPEKSAEPVAPPRGSAPRVGGPFADPAAPAKPKAEPLAGAPRSLGESAPRASLGASRSRLVAMGVLIAVTFFLLGRASMPNVQAADDGGEKLAGAGGPGAPETPAAKPSQSVTEALQDKDNKFSIVAVTYSYSPTNRALAIETAGHLSSLGLPSVAYEIPKKDQIVVLVGAQPHVADLDGLLKQVREAKTKSGRLDFGTAKAVQIDNYVVR